eukprot:jgi/Chrzof1/11313/Cz05g32040.t1
MNAVVVLHAAVTSSKVDTETQQQWAVKRLQSIQASAQQASSTAFTPNAVPANRSKLGYQSHLTPLRVYGQQPGMLPTTLLAASAAIDSSHLQLPSSQTLRERLPYRIYSKGKVPPTANEEQVNSVYGKLSKNSLWQFSATDNQPMLEIVYEGLKTGCSRALLDYAQLAESTKLDKRKPVPSGHGLRRKDVLDESDELHAVYSLANLDVSARGNAPAKQPCGPLTEQETLQLMCAVAAFESSSSSRQARAMLHPGSHAKATSPASSDPDVLNAYAHLALAAEAEARTSKAPNKHAEHPGFSSAEDQFRVLAAMSHLGSPQTAKMPAAR